MISAQLQSVKSIAHESHETHSCAGKQSSLAAPSVRIFSLLNFLCSANFITTGMMIKIKFSPSLSPSFWFPRQKCVSQTWSLTYFFLSSNIWYNPRRRRGIKMKFRREAARAEKTKQNIEIGVQWKQIQHASFAALKIRNWKKSVAAPTNIKIYVNGINFELNLSCQKNRICSFLLEIGLTIIKMMTPTLHCVLIQACYKFMNLWLNAYECSECSIGGGGSPEGRQRLDSARLRRERLPSKARSGGDAKRSTESCLFNDAPLEFSTILKKCCRASVKSPWINHIKYLRAHLAIFP